MPQLDAIDLARQEKSASVEEIPAQMKPVPMRHERKSSFRNSVAGRTAVGAVAAAIILGAAIYSYTPKQMSNADEQLGSQSLTQEPVTASNPQTESSSKMMKQDPKLFQKEPTSTDSTDSTDPSDPDQNGVEDKTATASESTHNKGSKKSSTDLTNPPANAADVTSPVKTEKVTPKEANGAGSKGSNTPTDPSSQANTKTTQPPAANKEGNGANNSTKSDLGVAEISNDDKAVSTNTAEPDPSANPSASGNGLESDATSGMYTMRATGVLQPLNSPDGKYTAVVEDKKLVIYSIGKDVTQNKAVRSFDLTGSWVSGVWSADSTVFTYQTADANGAPTSQTYQVNAATSDK
ncbi:hypothetical protein JCM16418_975 [Paenibacillus pini JCM 16418]|uniref:Uncharacterized protein n=2 Tax=Paenibacillus TaxID=44249 RepID=W7YX63_9BACL|nr:hypothetical protein JCM16418_975 [Paenibacillus pini JCM 16418]